MTTISEIVGQRSPEDVVEAVMFTDNIADIRIQVHEQIHLSNMEQLFFCPISMAIRPYMIFSSEIHLFF